MQTHPEDNFDDMIVEIIEAGEGTHSIVLGIELV